MARSRTSGSAAEMISVTRRLMVIRRAEREVPPTGSVPDRDRGQPETKQVERVAIHTAHRCHNAGRKGRLPGSDDERRARAEPGKVPDFYPVGPRAALQELRIFLRPKRAGRRSKDRIRREAL